MHLYARWRQVMFLRGSMYTLGIAIVCVLAGCFVDYVFDLTMLLRLLLTAAIYGTIAVFAFIFWLRPTFRPRSLEQIAWLMERTCPNLNQRLISSVELRDVTAKAVSQVMIAKVLSRVQIDMAKIKPSLAFPIDRRMFRFPLVALAVFLIVFPIPQLQMHRLVVRVLAPSPKQGSVGSFELNIVAPTMHRFIEGDSVFFIISSTNSDLREVSLFFEDRAKRVRRERVIRNEETGDFQFTLAGVYGDVDYWAKAGKVSTPVRRLSITKRPKLGYFQVQLTPPAYTNMPKTEYQSTSGDLKALVNTHVRLVLHASKPLSALEVAVDGEKIPVDLASDRRSGWCQLVVDKSTNYTITMRDENGLGNPGGMKYDITMMPDQAPKVSLYEPESDLYLSQNDRVRFEWYATDDFGVASHELQCILGDGTIHSIRMPTDDQEFDLELASLRLQAGDEVGFKIAVRDDVNQSAESELRTITIVNSGELTSASRFKTRIEQVELELTKASGRLNEIGDSIREVIDCQKASVAKSTDLAYHLIMLQHRIGRFDLKLEDILARVADLRDTSFFPNSHQTVELIRLSLFRQRVFGKYHQIEDMDSIEEGQVACNNLLAHIKGAVSYLKRHVNYCIANTITEHLLASAERLGHSSEGDDQATLKRLVRKARDLAEMTSSKEYKDLRKPASSKKLRRRQVAAALRRFYESNLVAMRDYKQIDKVCKDLAKELPPLDNELKGFVEQLELNNRKRDWETVERLKATFEARRTLRAAELVDNELLSRFLKRAIEEKSTRLVRFAAHAIPRMTMYHTWSRFQPLLASSAVAFDETVQNVISSLPEKRRPSTSEREQLTRMLLRRQDDLLMLLGFPFSGRRLGNDKTLSVLVKPLATAENGIKTVVNDLAKTPANQIEKSLSSIAAELRVALSRTVTYVDKAKGLRDLSRKSLLKELAPPSERLVEIREEIEALEEDLETMTAGDVHKIEKVSHELGKAIRMFERQAFVDIGQEEGDARSARNRMAIAAKLETISEQRLKRAAEILVRLDEEGDESERYASLLEIREALLSAVQDLRDVTDMMQLTEARDRGELSIDDSLHNERLLSVLAQSNLDHDIVDRLDQLNTVREASRRVGSLALRIRQLGEKEAPGVEFRHETNEVEQRLVRSLERLDPAVLSLAARRHAFRTRMTVDGLLAEIRSVTQRRFRNLSMSERSQIVAELRERLSKVSDETARMTAFRRLLGVPGAPSQRIVEGLLLADLAAVFTQLDRPKGHVRFVNVVKTLVLLRNTIDAAADKLYPRARRPGTAAGLNESPSVLPANVARMLDTMKHAIALPETAAETARNIGARITQNKRDARKLLSEVTLDAFDNVALKKYVKRQIERFDKAPLKQKAAIMNDIAKRLPDEAAVRTRLSNLEKALVSDQADEKRRQELLNIAREESAAGAAHVTKLLKSLEPLPQRAIVNDCKRIAEHYSDNMKLGDYGAAARTLVALRRNVRLLRTGLPQATPLPRPATQDTDEGIDETTDDEIEDDEMMLDLNELDWFACRAVLRIRALTNPSLRKQNAVAEQSALMGNYADAARQCIRVGSIDFSRAAWYAESAPGQPEELPEEYAQPLPLRGATEPWPMNEEAFHASAIANLVGNRQAIQLARVGRYSEAADSMDEMTEIVDGKARDMSMNSAEKYREAAEAELEVLPRELAEAMRKTEFNIGGLSGNAEKTLSQCMLACRQQRFEEAQQFLKLGAAYGKGVASPYFNALSSALKTVVKSWNRSMAQLPKDLQTALAQIKMAQRSAAQLNGTASDITQFELAQAKQSILADNYRQAAQHLAVAAYSLQGSDRKLIRQLSESMSRLDHDTYAAMNPPGRQAIGLLKRRREEIIEAAMDLDYEKAAVLADKARERDAAAAFRDAEAYQSEALGPDVEAATALLQESALAVDLTSESRSLIVQAARFLRENRMKDALRCIEIVTTPVTSRLELAQSVQEAVEFTKQHITPLTKAQALVHKNRFDISAAVARRSRFGADAVPVLLQAEEMTDNGIRAALRAAFEEKDQAKRRALEHAAQHARNNDLISAIARANAAGMTGRVAAQRFAEARHLGEEADQLLRSAVVQANAGNTPAKRTLTNIEAEISVAPKNAKRLLSQVRDLVKEQRYVEAAEMARRVDPGAFLALMAKQRLQDSDSQPPSPKALQQPSPAPTTYVQDLADAIADLERARCALINNEPIDVASDALSGSFDELTRSVGVITERTAKHVRKQLVERYDDATLDSLISGAARIVLERDWAKRISDRPLAFRSAPQTQFLIKQKQDFKAYYRDANRQYLKWIARESKRWQAEGTD